MATTAGEATGGAQPSVLMVSKPVAPPWNDSTKNLVRDIVAHPSQLTFHVLTTPGFTPQGPNVVAEPIYRTAGRYAPGLRANLRVFGRLLSPGDHALYHFFFAPNPRSSTAGRLAMRLRRRPSVQTVCSLPRTVEGSARLLFADRVVTVSEFTRARLEAEGVPDVRAILPGLPAADPLPEAARRRCREALSLGHGPLVLFAGDYEFSAAASTFAGALLRLAPSRPDTRFVFACRIKTPAARAAEAAIMAQVRAAGLSDRVTFLNEQQDMRSLVASADLQVLPADSTYAKMDLPLVLLESLREGVPVVVADVAPLNEVLQGDVGAAVPPRDPEALAAAMAELLDDPARRRAQGERCVELARTTFSAARMAEQYQQVYRELL